MHEAANRPKAGDPIQPVVATAVRTGPGFCAANLANGFGLDIGEDGTLGHDNHSLGATMWESAPSPDAVRLEFDLGGVYPLGSILVWNYNRWDPKQPDRPYVRRGLRDIRISLSVDRETWTELQGEGHPYRLAMADGSPHAPPTGLVGGPDGAIPCGDAMARHVRLEASPVAGVGNWGGLDGREAVFGLSAVRFLAGRGYRVEAAPEWTALFHRTDGWTGADASYSIPLSGDERTGTAGMTRTLFSFGDTFIGRVDPATGHRDKTTVMVNNSLALLDGGAPDPGRLAFFWGRDGATGGKAVFVPEPEASGYYYWAQDGLVVDGRLLLFALRTRENPDGAEGFGFVVDGADLLEVPLGSHGPELGRMTRHRTPLGFRTADGQEETFLCGAVMDMSHRAVGESGDGYVYVYGTRRAGPRRGLAVGRVLPEDFLAFDRWTFYDGAGWSPAIRDCAVQVADMACEFSVTPILEGLHRGRFLLVYTPGSMGRQVACRLSDAPEGPFGPPVVLFHTPEPDEGRCIYTYNAKAHPHLSEPGTLLVSYNVNASSWKAHFEDGGIYRTRWIRLCDTTV